MLDEETVEGVDCLASMVLRDQQGLRNVCAYDYGDQVILLLLWCCDKMKVDFPTSPEATTAYLQVASIEVKSDVERIKLSNIKYKDHDCCKGYAANLVIRFISTTFEEMEKGEEIYSVAEEIWVLSEALSRYSNRLWSVHEPGSSDGRETSAADRDEGEDVAEPSSWYIGGDLERLLDHCDAENMIDMSVPPIPTSEAEIVKSFIKLIEPLPTWAASLSEWVKWPESPATDELMELIPSTKSFVGFTRPLAEFSVILFGFFESLAESTTLFACEFKKSMVPLIRFIESLVVSTEPFARNFIQAFTESMESLPYSAESLRFESNFPITGLFMAGLIFSPASKPGGIQSYLFS